MPAKYLHVDDVALFVVHDGPSTLPGRPPIVDAGGALLAIHDAGRHGWDFSELRSTLAGTAGAPNLISFDQPGHGRSGELDSLSDVGRIADLTRAAALRMELDRPVLLGHGLGGAAALRLALDTPEAVSGVIVMSAGARVPVADEIYATMKRVTQGKARRPFDASVFAEGTAPETLRPYFMQGMKTDPRATFGDLTACREFDETGRAAELSVPLLVMVGEHERADLRSEAEQLASTVANATLEIVPGAAHVLPIEAPEAVAAQIQRFMKGLT